MTYDTCITSTGSKLLPDFFLDVDDTSAAHKMIDNNKKNAQSAPQGSQGGEVAVLFDKIKGLCNAELVQSVKGVFEFHLEGKEPGVWYLDLKDNSGKQRFCGSSVYIVWLCDSKRLKGPLSNR